MRPRSEAIELITFDLIRFGSFARRRNAHESELLSSAETFRRYDLINVFNVRFSKTNKCLESGRALARWAKSVTQLFNDNERLTFGLSLTRFIVFRELFFIKRDYFPFRSEINYNSLFLFSQLVKGQTRESKSKLYRNSFNDAKLLSRSFDGSAGSLCKVKQQQQSLGEDIKRTFGLCAPWSQIHITVYVLDNDDDATDNFCWKTASHEKHRKNQ